jgi:hypothetical protein
MGTGKRMKRMGTVLDFVTLGNNKELILVIHSFLG